jgi:regulator of nucleoside diphosphate kinase
MTGNELLITESDYTALGNLLRNLKSSGYPDHMELKALSEELKRAKVVKPEDLPEDVVRMNSTVKIKDLGRGSEMQVTLVHPLEASIKENKISVLAPLGAALIGFRKGSTVQWGAPSGIKAIQIIEVSQPL